MTSYIEFLITFCLVTLAISFVAFLVWAMFDEMFPNTYVAEGLALIFIFVAVVGSIYFLIN